MNPADVPPSFHKKYRNAFHPILTMPRRFGHGQHVEAFPTVQRLRNAQKPATTLPDEACGIDSTCSAHPKITHNIHSKDKLKTVCDHRHHRGADSLLRSCAGHIGTVQSAAFTFHTVRTVKEPSSNSKSLKPVGSNTLV